VKDRIEAAGATLRFLPPYSPDFNPIEKAFSLLKSMLRKIGEQTASGLWDLIGRVDDIFQPDECAKYFSSYVYDPECSKNALDHKLFLKYAYCRAEPVAHAANGFYGRGLGTTCD
jgi:hypothetical protein